MGNITFEEIIKKGDIKIITNSSEDSKNLINKYIEYSKGKRFSNRAGWISYLQEIEHRYVEDRIFAFIDDRLYRTDNEDKSYSYTYYANNYVVSLI